MRLAIRRLTRSSCSDICGLKWRKLPLLFLRLQKDIWTFNIRLLTNQEMLIFALQMESIGILAAVKDYMRLVAAFGH